MADSITIIVADDHPVFLEGLKRVLESEPGFTILSTAADGIEALAKIKEYHPDVAVLDIGMPNLDGIGLVKKLNGSVHSTSLIFMTMYRERKFYDRATEMGVKGYVLKDSAAGDVIEAIKVVSGGGSFVSPSLLEHLETAAESVRQTEASGIVAQLSPAERRVLELIAQYKTSREIAKELFVSPRTVETHRSNICQKLGLQGRHALMKFALNLIETSGSDRAN